MAILVFGIVKDINRHGISDGSTIITLRIAAVNSNNIETVNFGPYGALSAALLATTLKNDIKTYTIANWGMTWQALDTVRLFTAITDI
jgi:hypothetical protein